MKTRNTRRRTRPPLVLAALLLTALAGPATAAPAAGAGPGVGKAASVWERAWEWVAGWSREGLTALFSEEGSMIDPDGGKAAKSTGQGLDTQQLTGGGAAEVPMTPP